MLAEIGQPFTAQADPCPTPPLVCAADLARERRSALVRGEGRDLAGLVRGEGRGVSD
jgi:hypothetical protein